MQDHLLGCECFVSSRDLGLADFRQEAEAVLSAIAREAGSGELTGPARWRPNTAMRGRAGLPVPFGAA